MDFLGKSSTPVSPISPESSEFLTINFIFSCFEVLKWMLIRSFGGTLTLKNEWK